MCGIFCILSKLTNVDISNNDFQQYIENMYKKCIVNINKRGPDSQNSITKCIDNYNIYLRSSVLWLQGKQLVEQPIETEDSIFLYNGDIFDSSLIPTTDRNQNGDTILFQKLIESSQNLLKTLENVHGPYAFIYLDKKNSKLYFGRDIYGRRSLLISRDDKNLILSSVLSREVKFKTVELPALGIYCLDLKNQNNLSLTQWGTQNIHFSEKLVELEEFLEFKIKLEKTEPVELIFRNPESDDLKVFEEIERLGTSEAFEKLLANTKWSQNVSKIKTLLQTAVKTRVENQPNFCTACLENQISCPHSSIGILFSGGLDCSIIALLANMFIDKSKSIDLLNVAFERNGSFDSPDRLTARKTFEELKNLCPQRDWNLIEINVAQEELGFERSKNIADLIFPLKSILDESLGCALWFASRGKIENYVSPCRVLFVGMGADELFGGYTRHRAAFKRGSWLELAKELDKDWKNIGHRNLARDDRVVSDHGRQLRTPYLDENFVEFVRNLDPWKRCCPSEKLIQGLGDKMLLRTLAYDLGLKGASTFPKRALQFGSRIANKNENAHEHSPRL